jgi:SPX domain protein involved in polyphosphate accumulation
MKNNNITISDFRYERKFFITQLTKYKIESLVAFHPAIFSEIYSQRFVNNIYFDTHSFNNFTENVEGAVNRVKVRIRWYGNLLGAIEKPVLEIKIKQGLLGKKVSLPLNSFYLSEKTLISEILKNINGVQEVIAIDFKYLKPSLINTYSRKYYQSSDKKYRITIDNDQTFYFVRNTNNYFLNKYKDDNSVIMELKYDQKHDTGVDYITTNFPYRITKSSKYVNGIQQLFQVAF